MYKAGVDLQNLHIFINSTNGAIYILEKEELEPYKEIIQVRIDDTIEPFFYTANQTDSSTKG